MTDLSARQPTPVPVVALTAVSIIRGVKLEWGIELLPRNKKTVNDVYVDIFCSKTDDIDTATMIGKTKVANSYIDTGAVAGEKYYYWATTSTETNVQNPNIYGSVSITVDQVKTNDIADNAISESVMDTLTSVTIDGTGFVVLGDVAYTVPNNVDEDGVALLIDYSMLQSLVLNGDDGKIECVITAEIYGTEDDPEYYHETTSFSISKGSYDSVPMDYFLPQYSNRIIFPNAQANVTYEIDVFMQIKVEGDITFSYTVDQATLIVSGVYK